MLWRGCCDYYSLFHCPKIERRGREGVQSSFRASSMKLKREGATERVCANEVEDGESDMRLWLLFTLLLGNHNTGTRAERKELRSSKAEPGGGPRGRRGACGSGTNKGSEMPRGNHGARCGRWPRLGGIIKKNEKKENRLTRQKIRKKGRNKLKMFRRKEFERKKI